MGGKGKSLEGKICSDCSRGGFIEDGICRKDNSYFCHYHKKGICKYNHACEWYREKKKREN